jgi:hypothetical protein
MDDLAHTRALGHAVGQEHQGAPVVDEFQAHAGHRERFPDARLVGPRGGDKDTSDLIEDASVVELRQQSRRRRGRLVAEDPGSWEVEDRPVLRDHAVEEVEPLADAGEVEEGAPGHQDQAEPRLARALQGGEGLGTDPVRERQGAVVVTGERREPHETCPGVAKAPGLDLPVLVHRARHAEVLSERDVRQARQERVELGRGPNGWIFIPDTYPLMFPMGVRETTLRETSRRWRTSTTSVRSL